MDIKNLVTDNITLEYVLSDKAIFNALFNALEIHLFAIAKDGNYIVKNQILDQAISKLYPSEKPIHINAKEIDEVAWEDCCEIMNSGKTRVKEERAPNGRYYLSVKSPLRNKDEVVGVIGIAVDITDKKQAEIAKEEFLANMSHDLRIPFSGICSMADYLYHIETDVVKKEFLGNIVESSKGFLNLLTQILDLSQIQQTKSRLLNCNIRDEINQLAMMFQAELKIKGLDLIVDCPNVIIKTDRLKLAKILLNLLGNAIKFTQEGYIKIQVIIARNLNIKVIDTGIGIEKKHQIQIFEKFYKVKPSIKPHAPKGSGLGLFIVEQAVRELGGTLNLKSKPGQGSVFDLALPLH